MRPRLVQKPWQYRWSSAAAHTGRATDALLDLAEWRKLAGRLDWQAVLRQSEAEELISALRFHSRSGRPSGSESFLARLEAKLGCRVRAPGGPPAPR